MSEFLTKEQMASNWAKLQQKQAENRQKAEDELRQNKEQFEEQEKRDRELLRAVAEEKAQRVASISPQEKEQLQRLGKALVNRKKAEKKKTTIKVEEKKGRGRPKKEQGEKVQLVQAKLSPYYVTFLKDYGKVIKKGIPSTIRHMIYQFEIYQDRERRQVQKVRMMLREVESLFDQYGARYQRPDVTLELKTLKERISEKINRVRTLVSLLEFVGCRYDEKKRGEEDELKDRYHDYLADLLSAEEKRTYEMTKIWTEQLLPQ